MEGRKLSTLTPTRTHTHAPFAYPSRPIMQAAAPRRRISSDNTEHFMGQKQQQQLQTKVNSLWSRQGAGQDQARTRHHTRHQEPMKGCIAVTCAVSNASNVHSEFSNFANICLVIRRLS